MQRPSRSLNAKPACCKRAPSLWPILRRTIGWGFHFPLHSPRPRHSFALHSFLRLEMLFQAGPGDWYAGTVGPCGHALRLTAIRSSGMLSPSGQARRGGACQTPPGPRGSNGKAALPGAAGRLPGYPENKAPVYSIRLALLVFRCGYSASTLTCTARTRIR